MFDINPNPNVGCRRVTGIAGAVNRSEEQAGPDALAASCRLTSEQAQQISTQVGAAAASWRETAAQRGITKDEIARFADIFHNPAT
jgi:hypothetical protein